MTAGGLSDADRAFLLVPEQRQFAAFGQRLGCKLGRLMARHDGFDDGGSQESQAHQAPDIVGQDRFTPGKRCDRVDSTGEQIVSPLASPRDCLEERKIGQRRWCATALDDQPQLEAAPPDLERKDARNRQLGSALTLFSAETAIGSFSETRNLDP